METNKRGWHLDTERLVMFLTLKNARCAALGRPCPIAASVVARIESRLSYTNAMGGVK